MMRLHPPRSMETAMPKCALRTTTRNGLLATLPADISAALLPKFETVPLYPRQVLFRPETRSDAVYFLDCSFQGTAFALRIDTLTRLNRKSGAVPGSMDCR